tara:strand:- start:530 stop:670 length:141 start_codon:yes stop_codon:yes gene_type:complete
VGVLLGVWFFDLQAGETEKDGFGTDTSTLYKACKIIEGKEYFSLRV